ncbi:chromate resistance protein ChrB domain-containing protein [Desulfobacter sp.]|uniref:chromate resistance protein ChrB domain-containing protein n=1 Tax=Desulfobacter sp. TaxID=2294 RepID=UPI003D0D67C2
MVQPKKWLVLIHQIPPKPDALRVKIWRRLQQVGAVAIKQSVYVMPLTEQAREDLSWTLRQIVEGGGDGSISEARFVQGLSDEQILALFHNARKADYEKLIQEAGTLYAQWSSQESDPRDPAVKGPAQLSRLQRRLDDISAIDFFRTPERAAADLQLKALEKLLAGAPAADTDTVDGFADLKGKTWVTRGNLFVDRLACSWLIRRFVDGKAALKFVPDPEYLPQTNEIRFDMFDGEYTHQGDLCTFEVMIQRLQIRDHALGPLSEVVHDIDLKDEKFGRSETFGFNALLTGLVAEHPGDNERMNEGFRLFDNLYAYFNRQKRE